MIKNFDIDEIKNSIKPLDLNAIEQSKKHWMSIAKPLFSLGELENIVSKIAGIRSEVLFYLKKKALVVMCADNGIVDEGISQSNRDITYVVTENFSKGKTSSCIMSKIAGVDVFPIDIGVEKDVPNITDKEKKVAYCTKDFFLEDAMTREEAIKAINIGINEVKRLKDLGYDIILTGEMGIGNTTTSSAVVSVCLDKDPAEVTGVGAGLSSKALKHKMEIIKKGIEKRNIDKNDPIDILSKVGGLDIAGLCGVFLGGAIYRVPLVVDGFISSASLLIASRISKSVLDFALASHSSNEPAGKMVLEELGLKPIISAGMCLGEGTGAISAMPLFDMAIKVYCEMDSFDDIKIEQYQVFDTKK